MPIKYTWYKRRDIQLNPGILFVFGGNFRRKGFGGQAKEARDEPNAVEIATKIKPSMDKSAFLSDDLLDDWLEFNADAFMRIGEALEQGRVVVFPIGGLGTGLAELETRAPAIWRRLQGFIEKLEKLYGRV